MMTGPVTRVDLLGVRTIVLACCLNCFPSPDCHLGGLGPPRRRKWLLNREPSHISSLLISWFFNHLRWNSNEQQSIQWGWESKRQNRYTLLNGWGGKGRGDFTGEELEEKRAVSPPAVLASSYRPLGFSRAWGAGWSKENGSGGGGGGMRASPTGRLSTGFEHSKQGLHNI